MARPVPGRLSLTVAEMVAVLLISTSAGTLMPVMDGGVIVMECGPRVMVIELDPGTRKSVVNPVKISDVAPGSTGVGQQVPVV
ncbi:MAG: hypothetical protein IIA27_16195 [Gemmatimonadetes bacterium]|nr:hypothetical protein [Gemmatimonadota bacterium]